MIDLSKTFYLIAEYWLGELKGFIKISDDKCDYEVWVNLYNWLSKLEVEK